MTRLLALVLAFALLVALYALTRPATVEPQSWAWRDLEAVETV